MARPVRLILSCEHASNAVPDGLDLGVRPEVLDSHIGWDPGAVDAARRLQARFDTTLFAGEVSRLVVDLNRAPERPACVPERAFGVDVPGNAGLDGAARANRIARYHRPFRAKVSGAVRGLVGQRARCLHLSIHTFTPQLESEVRPYAAGILFDPSRPWEVAVAERLLAALGEAGVDARPNLPYAGTDDGTTTWLRTRFEDADYAGIEVELSQALTETGRDAVIDRVADVVDDLLGG